jgi:hypothetical protein
MLGMHMRCPQFHPAGRERLSTTQDPAGKTVVPLFACVGAILLHACCLAQARAPEVGMQFMRKINVRSALAGAAAGFLLFACAAAARSPSRLLMGFAAVQRVILRATQCIAGAHVHDLMRVPEPWRRISSPRPSGG